MSATPRLPSEPGSAPKSPVGLLIFSWLFVGIPLVWGVIQTIQKSLALFH
jgi:hypothetical protein